MAQKQALDEDSQQRHRQRREQQRKPVIHPKRLQSDVRRESPEHVKRAMRKIHDPKQTENHRKTQTQ